MDEFSDSGEPDPDEIPLDSRITAELFLEWRSPRLGRANPERMNNPLWEWLIASRLSAFEAGMRLGPPPLLQTYPVWCFERFGESTTPLEDGRIVFIGGEHEDYYDPHFYIYNDVVVRHPDGRVDIWGYPNNVFPPTDFHSATLIGNQIVILGNLGYPEQRKPAMTTVYLLDLDTFSITSRQTGGAGPGWLHRHQAKPADDGASIIVERGLLDRYPDMGLVENLDDWSLRIDDWCWTKLTDRQWPRWEVFRTDRKRNHLFDYLRALWSRNDPHLASQIISSLEVQIGAPPDLEVFATLFIPATAHEALPDVEEEFHVHRIHVHGVTVRYVERGWSIQMTVEGELPEETTHALTADLLRKFSILENAPCELSPF